MNQINVEADKMMANKEFILQQCEVFLKRIISVAVVTTRRMASVSE